MMSRKLQYSSFIFLLISCFLSTSIEKTIKQIHIVFRHGERSPSELYPNDPYNISYWKDGLGSLTKRGKLQMYELGKKLREKYGHFISDYYYPEDTKVLSSYSDRCLMSAQLFTSGFFIPQNEQIWNSKLLWQPVPISYKPRSEDNMLAAKRECAKYDHLYKSIFSFNPYKEKIEQSEELFRYLSNHTGMTIDTLRKVEELYNTLEIEEIHNFVLPDWTKKVYPDPMRSIASLNLASFTETEYMRTIKGGPFINKLLEDFEASLKHHNMPKLFIYSAHDLTLVNILRTLAVETELKPNFAAYIIFEMTNSTEIKIFYSNCGWCEEEELILKNCETGCNLEKFKRTLDPITPKNWTEECKK